VRRAIRAGTRLFFLPPPDLNPIATSAALNAFFSSATIRLTCRGERARAVYRIVRDRWDPKRLPWKKHGCAEKLEVKAMAMVARKSGFGCKEPPIIT
jgi:hypothetical protein